MLEPERKFQLGVSSSDNELLAIFKKLRFGKDNPRTQANFFSFSFFLICS